MDRAGQELAAQLGRWPTPKELAMRLGMTLEAVLDTRQHASSRFISLESVLQDSFRENGGLRWDPVDTDERNDPMAAAEHVASLHTLREALASLSERDRTLLRLRYEQARPFHEVGRQLGLSESRVCQLHKRILRQLRRYLLESLEVAA